MSPGTDSTKENETQQMDKKPGPAQVGAISKAQKKQKQISKCQSVSSRAPEKPESWTELARQVDALRFFNIHSVEYEKMKGGLLRDIKNFP